VESTTNDPSSRVSRRRVAAALWFLEWRQLVNTVRGLFREPRRLVVYAVLLLLAGRLLLVAPQATHIVLPAGWTAWLIVALGVAVLAPWTLGTLAPLYVAPADRTFLVAYSEHVRPLMARQLWYRLAESLRTMMGLVVLVVLFSRASGTLGVAVWLAPVFFLYLVTARMVAGALTARRIPVALIAGALTLGWLGLNLIRIGRGGTIFLGLNPSPAHWPLLATMMAGNPWPVALTWLALTAALGAVAVLWPVPASLEDWRLIDRWALRMAVRRGDSDGRELFRQYLARRLQSGGAFVHSHRFRLRGPGAVAEMEALSSLRQLRRSPWLVAAGAGFSIVGGVVMARAGHGAVVLWLFAMAYAGLLFTSVQSRLATVSHPVARDPLVLGAPGSGYWYVLAEEAVGFAIQVMIWGGGLWVATVLGLSVLWSGRALVLVVVGQFVIQSLRLLYWTLFPTVFERQVMARLLSMLTVAVVMGIPLVPLVWLGWPSGIPATAVTAVAEGASLSWWASRRLEWGRGPAPTLGVEQ